MLDIQFIRENKDLVQEKSKQKGYQVDVEQLLGFDAEHKVLLAEVEELRRQRNELADSAKGKKPTEAQIKQGKEIKEKLSELEHKLNSIGQQLHSLLKHVPNMPLDYVPVGKSENQNKIVKTVGDKPKFGFKPKSHWELLTMRGMMDKERAAKISGSRFVYLTGDIVLLQFAIIQYVFDSLTDQKYVQDIIDKNGLNLVNKSFVPVLPPALLRTEPYEASARLDAEEVTYKLADDDLWLNASAEHTLCTMYWNEILPDGELPIRYVGYSPSYRREAGTYGKDTEGIIRLHQFDKLEMEVFSKGQSGLEEHKLLIAIQERLMQSLGLHYQLLQKCTADIGKPNASGVDINCWFPGQDRYIETHTADYMTDYQARDLNIRERTADGTKLVHTNDATAFALGRILAAIVENHQSQDGFVTVPEVLQRYMRGKEKI